MALTLPQLFAVFVAPLPLVVFAVVFGVWLLAEAMA